MPNENQTLLDALGLDPVKVRSIGYPEFLQELKDHPEAADTAAALLVRAIKQKDEVDIESAEAFRRPYLRMLKGMGIPNYKALERIRGSQRLNLRIMKFLEAGAENGYQLHQMIVLVGGPGCGKSVLIDAFKAALEGQIVYAVSGCPVNENPINLLKLLKPEQLAVVREQLGLGTTLDDYLKVSGEPCAHCWEQAMKNGESGAPSLGKVKVDVIRLASRKSGIATWTPAADGHGCSLVTALRQGSRGIVDMPEAFSVPETAPGKAHELDVLLDATENRRIPSGTGECSKSTGYMPLDTVMIAQSNEGAWEQFLEKVPEKDRGKWLRRARILFMPYNTSRSEEVQAYQDFIGGMKVGKNIHIDPLALTMVATLSVASRMGDVKEVPLDLRVRMYDGEQIAIPKKFSSLSSSRASEDRWGGSLASASPKSNTVESKNLSVEDLWKQAGEEEGKSGLNMSLMLDIVSSLCEAANSSKHKALTALGVLDYLGKRFQAIKKAPGLTKDDIAILDRCIKEFLSDFETKKVGLVERELRRMLREQVLASFSPDYEQVAQATFDRYYLYATAFAKGDVEVFDPRFKRKVKVDSETGFMDGLERTMGKTSASEQEDFRRSLEATFMTIRKEQAEEVKDDPTAKPEPITWRTHPDIRRAIAKKLDDEIATKVQRCLTDELQLDEAETKLRAESLARFMKHGYSEFSAKVALDYFKEFKLWSSPEDVR